MAAERRIDTPDSFTADEDEPLIAIITVENGREVVRYVASDEVADRATLPQAIQDALALGGAWSDLDWDEVEAELYRIRHSNPPSPPVAFDWLDEPQ